MHFSFRSTFGPTTSHFLTSAPFSAEVPTIKRMMHLFSSVSVMETGVARCFLEQHTQTGEIYTK
jgi:hypothetical protein